MSWWRRDPSLWCRSPLHRYASRALRDNDAALRSRCFSKSPPSPAQHKDDDDSKRPAGLSNLEWVQLQHYRRWKRRLQEDPYRVLFGASNDMLNGKGLKQWEWVYKAFPKWMIRDINLDGLMESKRREAKDFSPPKDKGAKHKSSSPTQSSTSETSPAGRTYPQKVNISSEGQLKTQGSVHREPSLRTPKLDRTDDSTGVASPSDPRRPREQTISGQTDNFSNDSLSRNDTLGGQEVNWTPKTTLPQEVTPYEDSYRVRRPAPDKESAGEETEELTKEASTRENAFIAEFLADSIEPSKSSLSAEDKTKDWKQTVLERRASLGFVPKPRKTTSSLADASNEQDVHNSQTTSGQEKDLVNRAYEVRQLGGKLMKKQYEKNFDTLEEPIKEQEVKTVVHNEKSAPGNGAEEWLIQPRETMLNSVESKNFTLPNTSRSTSDILGQLPKDDIDFLSAEYIRASMGGKKGIRENVEEKTKLREKLEKDFKDVHAKDLGLDPVIESKIVNDQHVRRTERKMNEQNATNDNTKEASPSEPLLENSLDRMTRWLEAGGDVFTRHFWSDPVSASEALKQVKRPEDPLLRGILSKVQDGKRELKHIREELGSDLPSAKPLLGRLKNAEREAQLAVGSLIRYRKNSQIRAEFDVNKARKESTEQLIQGFMESSKEFEEACKAIDTMSSANGSGYFEDRLRDAFEALNKTAQSTRRMQLSLSTVLRLPKGANPEEPLHGVIASRLSALYQTQINLLKLVDHAMLRFDIAQKRERDDSHVNATVVASSVDNGGPNSSLISSEKTSASTGNVAAERKLKEEIRAQKSAMRGLSDDGYTRSPKPVQRKSLDEPKPLTHSLFRPFGLQLESLGKDTDAAAEDKSGSGNDALSKSQQLMKDRALVQEVRKAYEDVYGPITIHHRQCETDEDASPERAEGQEKITIRGEPGDSSTETKIVTDNKKLSPASSAFTELNTSTTSDAQKEETVSSDPAITLASTEESQSATISSSSSSSASKSQSSIDGISTDNVWGSLLASGAYMDTCGGPASYHDRELPPKTSVSNDQPQSTSTSSVSSSSQSESKPIGNFQRPNEPYPDTLCGPASYLDRELPSTKTSHDQLEVTSTPRHNGATGKKADETSSAISNADSEIPTESPAPSPITYKILAYDPTTDELSITTTASAAATSSSPSK